MLTRRHTRNADALEVGLHYQLFPDSAFHNNRNMSGHPLIEILSTSQTHTGDLRQSLDQFLLQFTQHRLHCRQVFVRQFAGLADSYDVGQTFSAREQTTLLSTTKHDRHQVDAFAHIKESNSFRRIELVPGHGQSLYRRFLHVHRHLRSHLHCIRVEEDSLFRTDLCHFFYRLHGADLIVRPHERNDAGFRSNQ